MSASMNRWTDSTVAHYLFQRDAEAVPRAELARLRRIEQAARDVREDARVQRSDLDVWRRFCAALDGV